MASFEADDYDHLFKVVLLGDSGVGKSSLLTRYTRDIFDQETHTTIGVEFASRSIKVDGKDIRAQIWDTAGAERYRALVNAYYRGADSCLLVYDITSTDSFDHAGKWLEELRTYAGAGTPATLVGNKTDLAHLRRIDTEKATDYCEKNGLSFIETSALNASNVEEAFRQLMVHMYKAKAAAAAGKGGSEDPREEVPLGNRIDIVPETKPGGQNKSRCCGG